MTAPRDDVRRRVFHEGETAVHERCGIRERIEQVGPHVIRDQMPLQHRQFFATQPLLFVGSLDARGRPWASVLAAAPGFAHAPDSRTLVVDAAPLSGDALEAGLTVGAPLGLLGIEFATRRRNRMNGTVTAVGEGSFAVAVDQSFGNCPQYIQARSLVQPTALPGPGPAAPSAVAAAVRPEPVASLLGERAEAIVRGADTFFIASASAHAGAHAGAEGVDVSHRGGRRGFVRVDRNSAGTASALTIPDFRGNFLFNTVGNLVARPQAGLLFVDFANGDVLQLTGRADVIWDGPEVEAFAGAQRLVIVTVDEGVLHPAALPLAWSSPEYAFQLEGTGTWEGAGSEGGR